MLEHRVGIRVKESYYLLDIDEDFFDDF